MADLISTDPAHGVADDLLDSLHQVQADHSGAVAVACALAAISAGLNFVRQACGHEGALTAVGMSCAIVRDRLDVVVPAGRTRK